MLFFFISRNKFGVEFNWDQRRDRPSSRSSKASAASSARALHQYNNSKCNSINNISKWCKCNSNNNSCRCRLRTSSRINSLMRISRRFRGGIFHTGKIKRIECCANYQSSLSSVVSHQWCIIITLRCILMPLKRLFIVGILMHFCTQSFTY